jgi:hypothetical protein
MAVRRVGVERGLFGIQMQRGDFCFAWRHRPMSVKGEDGSKQAIKCTWP